MRVLVTGASGFVGRVLCPALLARGHSVVRGLRRSQPLSLAPPGCDDVVVGDIHGGTDWSAALRGVDVVAHLAARVHVMSDSADGAEEHRRVNAEGTAALARAAYGAGVRRLVFMSTIKVNGEERESAYGPADTPAPTDPYGVAKLLAEQALFQTARETGGEAVVIRPPLVFGPGAKGNFPRLLSLVGKGLPLPFGSIRNRRSLVSVWNLVDLTCVALEHASAPGGVYFAAEERDLSTPELLGVIARAMGRRPNVWPFPPSLLRALFALVGRNEEFVRLSGSLCVDRSPTRNHLGWTPPVSLEEGMAMTVAAHLQRSGGREPS